MAFASALALRAGGLVRRQFSTAAASAPTLIRDDSALYALLRQSATESVPSKGLAPDQLRGPVVPLLDGYGCGVCL